MSDKTRGQLRYRFQTKCPLCSNRIRDCGHDVFDLIAEVGRLKGSIRRIGKPLSITARRMREQGLRERDDPQLITEYANELLKLIHSEGVNDGWTKSHERDV